MNKKKILSTIAVCVLTGSIFTSPVHAQTKSGWGAGDFFSNFVSFFAQKFNLNKEQVHTALQEFKSQQKANGIPRPTMSPDAWKAREKERLDRIVKEGKITQAQADTILAELVAVHAKYKIESGETADTRKTNREAMRTELTTWAKDNNIDLQYVIGMGGNRGRGRGFGMEREDVDR